MIFYLSGGQASFDQTSRIIGPLLQFLFPGAAPEALAEYHGYIRKLAHVAVYAVLGLFAMRAFDRHFSGARWRWSAIALSVVLAVASLDEINQSILASRTGATMDVLLDVFGGSLAIGAVLLWTRARNAR